MTTTKRLWIALLLVVVTLPAHADFNSVARAISKERGVTRVWIPFLGVARMMVRVVEPKGVNDFQLATFEGADDLDPRHLERILREKVGQGFSPLVQVRSRKSDEWTFIYARPHGDRIELIVLTKDDDDTVLVRVDVDADEVAREIHRHPRQVTRMARQ